MDEAYRPPANGWRTFLIVWGTQSVSVFGSALTFFALNIWLTQTLYARPEQKPQLAAALSAISLAFAIPVVFGAPLAGAWADRHDRKRTMLVMDFANGAVSLVLALTVLTNTLTLPLLLALLVVAATLAAFHAAAFDTSYSMLVPKDRLPRANGMMQTMWSLSGLISPAMAAGIISLPALARQGYLGGALGPALAPLSNGSVLAMAVDAITFLAAAGTLLFVRVPSPRRSDLTSVAAGGQSQKKSMWADIREGGMYIWRRRPLLWLLATFTIMNFAAGPIEVMLPMVLKFNLAANWGALGFSYETALALVNTIGATGGVAGGLIISAWGGLKGKRVYGVVVPLLFAGAGQIALGLAPTLYLCSACLFLVMGLSPILNSHSQAIWQTQTPHELQGRVFSVRRLIAQCSWPVSAAIAGWAGGIFNPGHVIACLGLLGLIFVAAQLFNPYLRQVEDKAALDRMAARAEAGAG